MSYPTVHRPVWNRPYLLISLAITSTLVIYGSRQYLRQPLPALNFSSSSSLITTTEFTGKVEPSQDFKIAASTPGIMRQLKVKVGDRVIAGQSLMQLENLGAKQELEQQQQRKEQIQQQRQDAQQQQETAYQQTLQLQQKIASSSNMASINRQVDEAQQNRTDAELRLQHVPLRQRQDSIARAQAVYGLAQRQSNRMEQLMATGAISRADADRARTEAQIAQADLASAQEASNRFQDLTQEQQDQRSVRQQLMQSQQQQQVMDLYGQLQLARSQYEQATRRLATLSPVESNAQIVNPGDPFSLEVKATQSGVVVELPTALGDQVFTGAPLIKLAQLDRLTVKVPISARLVNSLQKGQKATIKLEVNGEFQEFSGSISTISPMPAADLNHQVEVQFANPDGQLLVGQSAKVYFQTQP
jgi:multidrug efflux pump subunit AcrA (membrane-fusion protein)